MGNKKAAIYIVFGIVFSQKPVAIERILSITYQLATDNVIKFQTDLLDCLSSLLAAFIAANRIMLHPIVTAPITARLKRIAELSKISPVLFNKSKVK